MLNIKGLGRRYGERWVLRELNLNLGQGEFVAVVGESGGGKTTLLNLIAGLDVPDEGEVFLADKNLYQLSDDQRTQLRGQTIGFVFQSFHLLNHLQAWQNVVLPLLLAQHPANDAKLAAEQLLDRLGLSHRRLAYPAELSGGEQQRVALARALVIKPKLILADEPTGNLDPGSAGPALALLRQQCQEIGTSIVMVTHSEQAAGLADRRLRLENGALVG
jgi:putative ABC transport system ATP-binding protein